MKIIVYDNVAFWVPVFEKCGYIPLVDKINGGSEMYFTRFNREGKGYCKEGREIFQAKDPWTCDFMLWVRSLM